MASRVLVVASVVVAAMLASSAGTARAAEPVEEPPSLEPKAPVQMPDEPGDDPLQPGRSTLRWQNQIGEGRLEGAALFSTPRHGGRTTTTGWEAGYAAGSTPQLKWFRIGGVYGLHVKMWDDKSFTLSPYYELTGGIRVGPAELFAFCGVSWINIGVSHTNFALGLVSPRAGVALGSRIGRSVALHGFVASEYNWGVLGFDDFRTQMVGLRVTLLSAPAPTVVVRQR